MAISANSTGLISSVNLPTKEAVNNLITSKLPFEGAWYYPNSGINSIIFPDFFKANQTSPTSTDTNGSSGSSNGGGFGSGGGGGGFGSGGSSGGFGSGGTSSNNPTPVFYSSSELVNAYAAYSSANPETAPYQYASKVDPVATQDTQKGLDFIPSDGQYGLQQTLLGIYSSISYTPDKANISAIQQAKTQMATDMASVADDWSKTLAKLTVDGPTGYNGKLLSEKWFGSSVGKVTPSMAYTGCMSFLNHMLTLICYNPDVSLEPGSTIDDYYQSIINEPNAKSLLQAKLYGYIKDGSLDWDKNFTGEYLSLDGCDEACFDAGNSVKKQLPLEASDYALFQAVVTNGEETIIDDINVIGDVNNVELTSATAYLHDLVIYNEDATTTQSTSVPKNQYLTIAPGIPNKENLLVPVVTATPNPGPSGSEVEFTLSSSTVNSNTATDSEGNSHSWDDSASGGYWIFSASASDKGESASGYNWAKMDASANSMVGTFKWTDIKQTTVTYSPLWYLNEALNQAWEQTMTNDNPKFQGGSYAFDSPEKAAEYISTAFYSIHSLAYGYPDSTITGKTSSSNAYSAAQFSKFQQTTSASFGVGWGPFSMNSEHSWSKNSDSTGSQMSSTQKGQTFTVTNDPIKNVNPVEGAGDPYGVIGMQVNTLTKPTTVTVATVQDAKNLSSTSTTALPAGASSRAKKKKTKTIVSITHSDAKNNKNNQFIFGSEHNIHYGSEKNNHIKGRGGDDVIAGLEGNDKIHGGSGDDVLYGGNGKNHIHGGKGSDYVVFQKENVKNGAMNIIYDFKSNDKISLSGYIPEEVSARNNFLILDGNTAGKFRGLDKNDIISMIEDAHFSA